MNDIEKAARLMGKPEPQDIEDGSLVYMVPVVCDVNGVLGYEREYFNPLTNKADLVDVETELGIGIRWNKGFVMASTSVECWYESFKDHPTKFAARAEAVMSVVSQLYDAKFGKDGE